MKRKALCNCFCSSSFCDSASRVQKIGVCHVRDFGPCHNVKSHVCCGFLIPSENVFVHFKEHLKRHAKAVFRKKLFVILCSAVQKLNKLSILSLLVSNYSSVYLTCLFDLSIHLTILLVVGVSYQRVNCLTDGEPLLLNLGEPFYVGVFFPHWRWPSNSPEQKIIVSSGGMADYTPAYIYLQNAKNVPVGVG